MALDEALLNNFKEGDLPILRLYRWEPSISLGRFSNAKNSLNLKILEQQKLSCVRRMSGGGILVHGGDLSYTLIVPRKSLKRKSVKENYHYLCQFLIHLYEKLGHDSHFAIDLQMEGKRSDICLAGNEPYDIIIQGKKIGGNAQRYTREALFQHGSIPIKVDEAYLKAFFLKDSGLKRTATLERLGNFVTYEQLTELLKETFCETFNVNVVPDTLRSSEEQSAKRLLTQKYTKQRWNIYAESHHA